MSNNAIKIKFTSAHNVFKKVAASEEHYDRHQPDKLRVHAFLQPLIAKLLMHNPRWEFIASDYASGDNGLYVHGRFHIECDGEELGWVGLDTHWSSGERRYEFDCLRLKQKRQKSTTPHTKDLNKAVKAIVGHMYNRTPAERMATAKQHTIGLVGRIAGNAEHQYRMVLDRLLPHMTRFVERHWDEFCEVRMDEVGVKARNALPTTKQALLDSHTISNPMANTKGYLVIEAGSTFIVSRYSMEEAPITIHLGKMPDRLKGSLGILKLLEPKKYAPGIGMRVDETTFYVVDADE